LTEDDAWEILHHYAQLGNVRIEQEMSVRVLRRNLAKVFQPRTLGDDDSAMRRINPALDLIELERDRRELLGISENNRYDNRADCTEPWQTDPSEPTTIYREDYTDPNYIRKVVYERALRFGDVELMKAWSWNGERFRKILSAYANQFALDELGRGLLQWQMHLSNDARCDAIFLTKGDGPAKKFKLVIIRIGRGYENVVPYGFDLEGDPYDPKFSEVVPSWLRVITAQLNRDRW
jgi:hypothetical protein